jgi:hypothetical protein
LNCSTLKGAVRRLAVLAGHLVLPAGAVAAAVKLQKLGLEFRVPVGIEPGGPAKHRELLREREPVICGVPQAVRSGIDAQPAA